ncbi:MAG TPA: S4 domain-containing protein [Steroidobacteraceae bacterium]|nr:S4 domain-containing protein [Steroidobacteraceae bacterium]
MTVETIPGVRLDLWLWTARFFKTRSLARQAVDNGKVEVGGQRAKAARLVRVGDALRIERGEEAFEIEVRGISNRRGPASAAQALYVESEASRQRRETERATRAAERAGYQAPHAKPDKRARRLIRALGDIDAL